MHPRVENIFQPLYGLPGWGVHWERFLNLSMNFGQPSLSIREPQESKSPSPKVRLSQAHRRVTVRGEWWLWIYCSYWKLSVRGIDAVTGSASQRQIRRALALLDGQKFEQVEINASTAATRFIFDLGGILEVRRLKVNQDEDLWILYTPAEHTLSVRGDGNFAYTPGNQAKDQWETLRASSPAKNDKLEKL